MSRAVHQLGRVPRPVRPSVRLLLYIIWNAHPSVLAARHIFIRIRKNQLSYLSTYPNTPVCPSNSPSHSLIIHQQNDIQVYLPTHPQHSIQLPTQTIILSGNHIYSTNQPSTYLSILCHLTIRSSTLLSKHPLALPCTYPYRNQSLSRHSPIHRPV